MLVRLRAWSEVPKVHLTQQHLASVQHLCLLLQWNGPGESARLPARDVLIKQMAHGGDPAQMFSIGTRAAWDATVRLLFPSALLACQCNADDQAFLHAFANSHACQDWRSKDD